MKKREAIPQPFLEKDPNKVEKHPNPSNSAVFIHGYGRLEKIEPTTPENLNIYEPELPPKSYGDGRVNRKPLIDKSLPEGKFASGTSPFIQAVFIKTHEMEERRAADEPKIKSDIMSEAKVMNWRRVGEHLKGMVYRGLIKKVPGGKWVATEGGRKILEKYDELVEMIEGD